MSEARAASSLPRTIVYLDHTAKWSGGEIALLRSLEALDQTRVDPVVVLASDGPFAERLREAGIETHILPLGEDLREVRKDSLGARGIFKHAGSALGLLRYAGRVARFARQRGAVLLHCNSLKSDIYGAAAGRIARLPVLWHVRDHISPGYLPGPAVKLFRTLARRVPSYVVTNSASTTEELFPGGAADPRRCRAVNDGLSDSELTAPEPPVRDAWRHNPPRIGMVGRLVEWKGQHVFLEAAKRLTEAGMEARYVLIGAPLFGEEDYEARLREQAVGLGDRVEFTGFRTDVAALLRDLDILVHASITPEPFGQVVIEGMAEGLPVVASDGGGVREIVRNGVNGVLTPMGDAGALADALSALLRDPARASGIARAGWRNVRENFTAAHSARGLEAVYDVMLSAAGPRQTTSPQQRRSASQPGSSAGGS